VVMRWYPARDNNDGSRAGYHNFNCRISPLMVIPPTRLYTAHVPRFAKVACSARGEKQIPEEE
jgi:hypothetical protein